MKVTTNIVYDHRGRASGDDKGQVEVRITVDRRSYYVGTGVKVLRSQFAAGRVCNCAGANELNDRIAIIYSKVCAAVNDAVENGGGVDIKAIREEVWQVVEQNSDEPTLINWISEQIPMLAVSEGTRAHYRTMLMRLVEFGRMTRWRDVSTEMICEWDAWLRSLTKPQSDAAIKAGVPRERLSVGCVYNYHKTLKAMLGRADRFGKIDRNPYEKLRGKFAKGEKASVEYLSEDEMEKITALMLRPGSALDVARDLFVFQMYTGLSFSDAQAFDIKDYRFDGQRWSHVGERIKTGVPYVSVLLPPVIQVLAKYGMQVPILNNAEYNQRLKGIGEMAGIKTRLHSHLARHTFATWMLRNGAKIENVSRMLGHTNITQTQRYAKVLAQSVRDEFKRIENQMTKTETHEKINDDDLHGADGGVQ